MQNERKKERKKRKGRNDRAVRKGDRTGVSVLQATVQGVNIPSARQVSARARESERGCIRNSQFRSADLREPRCRPRYCTLRCYQHQRLQGRDTTLRIAVGMSPERDERARCTALPLVGWSVRGPTLHPAPRPLCPTLHRVRPRCTTMFSHSADRFRKRSLQSIVMMMLPG